MNPTPTPNSDPLGPKLDGRAALERSLEKLDSPSPQPVDIARLRGLLAKATPGPWDKVLFIDYAVVEYTRADGCLIRECLGAEDRNIIAALRNDAPALLDELERLRAEPKAEDAILIRCIPHRSIRQQNHNEINGGECGACIAAERDSLRQQNERLLKEIEELRARPTGLWKENY